MSCEHMQFVSFVSVHRLHADEGQPDPHSFIAELRVHCADCGAEFGFKGLRAGMSFQRPMVDVTGRQVSLPLASPTEMALSPEPELFGLVSDTLDDDSEG